MKAGRGELRGDDHPRARLTSTTVRVLRLRVLAGETIKAVARDAKLPVKTVYDAVTGRTWSSIEDPPPLGVRVPRWTAEQEIYLASHADEWAPDVAEAIGRTAHAVRQKRSKEQL